MGELCYIVCRQGVCITYACDCPPSQLRCFIGLNVMNLRSLTNEIP